jgi:hypothetical protein
MKEFFLKFILSVSQGSSRRKSAILTCTDITTGAVFTMYYKAPVCLVFNFLVLNGELRDFCYKTFKTTFFTIHYLPLLLLVDSLKLRFSHIRLNFDEHT